jgi:hypothetical protein
VRIATADIDRPDSDARRRGRGDMLGRGAAACCREKNQDDREDRELSSEPFAPMEPAASTYHCYGQVLKIDQSGVT